MAKLLPLLAFAAFGLGVSAQSQQVDLTFLATSDVHGNYLPYDFINAQPGKGSLARVATYVNQLRQQVGRDAVVLLDNGDILQGQPTAYYYNFIDTTSTHLCAQVLNEMGYDAATVGNHDVETGHAVYDRWTRDCQFPVLAANAVSTATATPYWKPYTILERKGVKIAVFGLITPAIPQWLPENLWRGIRFEDMVRTARHYMPQLRAEADVVVGLFHSGVGKSGTQPEGAEHAALQVAREVPGFDLIFCGHDHRLANQSVLNTAGDSVLVLNPAANAEAVAQAQLRLQFDGKKWVKLSQQGEWAQVDNLQPDAAFMKTFAPQYATVKAFTEEIIGQNEATMETLPAFFGPSAFIDFIHTLQLAISGADLSFAAPLSFDAVIPKGAIRVSDMFNLYRYENMLYTMRLTGREVKDYLEYSYAGWVAQMKKPTDHLLLFRANAEQLSDSWQRLRTPSFNFDSAAGLRYTVDVTKPAGQRITITSLADGRPFSLDATYLCAINSYRGNGGGRLLTEGAGIPAEELSSRIVRATDKDLRYYLMQAIRQRGTIHPAPLNQWKFIPEDWAAQARKRDEQLLLK